MGRSLCGMLTPENRKQTLTGHTNRVIYIVVQSGWQDTWRVEVGMAQCFCGT